MLVRIKNNKPVSVINMPNTELENIFLENNEDFIKSDFKFVDALKYYTYSDVSNSFSLLPNVVEIKAAEKAAVEAAAAEELRLEQEAAAEELRLEQEAAAEELRLEQEAAATELLKDLHEGVPPEYEPSLERIEVDGEEIIEGKRYTKYVIIDLTPEEITAYEEALAIKLAEDLAVTKDNKLVELKHYTDAAYESFLKYYPKVEQESFLMKSAEAKRVENDPLLALTETPYLSSLVFNSSIENRNQLAIDVNEKVHSLSALETLSVLKRDEIYAAETVEECEAITFVGMFDPAPAVEEE